MENQRAGSETTESADGTGQEALLELLADERRRHVVAALREATAPVAVADLARRVADWEPEPSSTAAPSHQQAVQHSLYHWHVPKLAAAGIVEHDEDRNTVEPGPRFERAVDLWRSVQDLTEPDSA